MFCKVCGAEIPDTSTKCSQCGNNPYDETIQEVKNVAPEYEFLHSKSRIVAGLLQIFLGMFAAGRFYLGYTSMALKQWQSIISESRQRDLPVQIVLSLQQRYPTLNAIVRKDLRNICAVDKMKF